MRSTSAMAVLVIFLLGISAFSLAELNKCGVADQQSVTFIDAIKVGGVLLPKGEYKVEHAMEGENHIMVFTQLNAKHPATARTKCQLVPVQAKIQQTQILYVDSNNTHVLQELYFRGDTAKHVF